jgi:small subunit ribosomal protein S15
MARIHAHRKGKSHSRRPPYPKEPSWLTYSKQEVVSLVVKLAKEGLTPSQIGQRLRDEYGIPLVKPVVGKSIVEILRDEKLAPSIPEDLNNLMIKANRISEHLRRHRGDRRNVHNLELVEARIHRLAKYYKRRGLLPPDWKFTPAVAQLE